MPSLSPLLALTRSDPTTARATILSALAEHGGNRVHAARALHVHRGLLLRCVDLLDMRAAIADRWPDRVRGGGVQSDEHLAKIEGLAKKRWSKPLETRGFEGKVKKDLQGACALSRQCV